MLETPKVPPKISKDLTVSEKTDIKTQLKKMTPADDPANWSLEDKLMYIQLELQSPKDKTSQAGSYSFNYRSAEQILFKLKPLLLIARCYIIFQDKVEVLGVSPNERFYIKSTANLCSGKDVIAASAYAREAVSLGSMSPGQISGATISYARKYALGALFAIDDGKDLDEAAPKVAAYTAKPKEPITYRGTVKNEFVKTGRKDFHDFSENEKEW